MHEIVPMFPEHRYDYADSEKQLRYANLLVQMEETNFSMINNDNLPDLQLLIFCQKIKIIQAREILTELSRILAHRN